MPKLYYFQAPNFSINVESETAPKLGSIFPNLDRLTNPLNQFEHVHIPTSLTNQSAAEDFKENVDKSFTGAVGLNANLVQGIAGTAEVVYAFARDKSNVYRCETLDTVEFEPNEQFINDSIIASQRVQSFLDNALVGRKKVYMITGLKIATGFSMSTSKAKQHGPTLQLGVDATALGVPAEAGPEVELGVGNFRTVSHGRTANKIVFAYRVIRIKRRRDGQAKYKYKSGGKYTTDEDESDEEEPWELELLDEEDLLKDFPEAVPMGFHDPSSSVENV
ncbi:Nn.00g060530.m01.CDS01 [Neocucurbitaria sp. VM-36]